MLALQMNIYNRFLIFSILGLNLLHTKQTLYNLISIFISTPSRHRSSRLVLNLLVSGLAGTTGVYH